MDIHIIWEGPFRLNQLKKLNTSQDYGLYQVYGHHQLYGKDVLLYLGKANLQTFAKRLKQEQWDEYDCEEHLKIYVGRIAAKKKDWDKWNEMIDKAEKLLIYAHNPIRNIANTKYVKEEEYKGVHIFNWDDSRDLMYEVSWKRWGSKFNNITCEDIIDASIEL